MIRIFLIAQAIAFILSLSACHQATDFSSSLNQLQFKLVHIKHGQIEYYEIGQGSPIILISGYAVDVSGWNRAFLTNLAKNHRVIVFNNRYVGRSFVKSTQYNTVELAEDTYQLMQQLHLKKPAIIGISMGGMIAQQLAVRHPQQLGQVVLINTAIAGKQSVWPSAEIKQKMFELPGTKLARFISAMQLFFPSSSRVEMSYVLVTDRFLPVDYKEIDSKTIMPIQQQLLLNWGEDNQTAAKMRHLKVPVLILNGEADIVIPPVNSMILAHQIPKSRLIRWKEGGHGMIYQYPEPIAQVITQFIANTQQDF